jgi:hypothetical protein
LSMSFLSGWETLWNIFRTTLRVESEERSTP